MSGPLRIVELSTFHESCGIATYTEALMTAFAAHGAEVMVVSPFLQAGGVALGAQPERLWARNRATIGQALSTVKHLRSLHPDVVHLQVNLGLFSIRFTALLVRACRRAGLPVVATLHGRYGGRLDRRVGVSAMLLALRGVPVIVHNAEHAAEIGRADTHVIAHGIGPVQRLGLADAKRAIGVDPGRRVLAHFGFIHPDKGIAPVMRAVAELRRRGLDLHYRVVGGTFPTRESRGHLSELRELGATLGLGEALSLGGDFATDERVLSELRAADWVALNYTTGQNQGTSGAARHAMRSGRPLAVSVAPVFDDLRHAAYTLTEPIADDLERMLGDAELTARIADRCRAYCDASAWPVVASRHLELFERVVARG